MVPPTPILILPGYGDSGPDHWQSLWEAEVSACRRVVQRDWMLPRLEEWLDTLARHVGDCEAPPVLVAHSLACSLVAHWVARSGVRARGALLVAPADVDSPTHTPDEVRGFSPMPLARFPFPSIVVASTDDPFSALSRGKLFARSWGSRLVVLPGAGHINGDTGFGKWPQGRALLGELVSGS
ncbi:MAG TPA: alpha/beta hydrolase [Methylomirabilota bacterium]|nr:alpha/beta hydrolase [Methylomirabilota bacterium]